jgi:hypothetical protein
VSDKNASSLLIELIFCLTKVLAQVFVDNHCFGLEAVVLVTMTAKGVCLDNAGVVR